MKNIKVIYCLLFIGFVTLLFVGQSFGATITPEQGKEKVKAGALLVDVRTPDEFSAGHVKGAINIPHDQVEQHLAQFGPDKNRPIVLYCRSGRRSAIVDQTLSAKGFSSVFNAGGYDAWIGK